MGIMNDISGYFSTAPAADSYLGQVMDYGMRFGGSQFGITPQQTAAYLEDRKQKQTADFIRQNQVQGENPGPYPVGSPEMNAAMQPRFNPNMEMELAARTGTLGQYMAGMQAMQRQQQEQVYNSNNMSAAQYASNQLQQQKFEWEKEREEARFNDLSAYQKATLDRIGGGGGGGGSVAGQPLGGAQLGSIPSGHMLTTDPRTGQPVLTPIQGGEAWRGQRENVQRLETGVQAVDQMIDFVKRKGSFETGAEGGRMAAGPRQTVIAGLAALNNMGVLQPGELAVLEQQLVDPTSWGSLAQSNSTALGKLEGVKERFVKASKAASSRTPGASSAPPPPEGFR
jgi:hypothetical protein